MCKLVIPTEKNAAAGLGASGAATTIQQPIPYRSPAELSTPFCRQARKFLGRLSIGTIREVLGLILLSLSWESTSNSDRAILLTYADALERLVVDFRRGELRQELGVAS